MPYGVSMKGGDHEDPPADCPLPHVRTEKAGQPEHRENIDPEHLCPVLLRRLRERPAKVIGARAVDKDRYLAKLRNRNVEYLLGSLLAGEICQDERCSTPIRRDVADGRLPLFNVDICADQPSTFARDCFRKSPSYGASDSGDQSSVLCEKHDPQLISLNQ